MSHSGLVALALGLEKEVVAALLYQDLQIYKTYALELVGQKLSFVKIHCNL
jgi:hypothetical protein